MLSYFHSIIDGNRKTRQLACAAYFNGIIPITSPFEFTFTSAVSGINRRISLNNLQFLCRLICIFRFSPLIMPDSELSLSPPGLPFATASSPTLKHRIPMSTAGRSDKSIFKTAISVLSSPYYSRLITFILLVQRHYFY